MSLLDLIQANLKFSLEGFANENALKYYESKIYLIMIETLETIYNRFDYEMRKNSKQRASCEGILEIISQPSSHMRSIRFKTGIEEGYSDEYDNFFGDNIGNSCLMKKNDIVDQKGNKYITNGEIVLLQNVKNNESRGFLAYVNSVKSVNECSLELLDSVEPDTSERYKITKITNISSHEKVIKALKHFTTSNKVSKKIQKLIVEPTDFKLVRELAGEHLHELSNTIHKNLALKNKSLNKSQVDAITQALTRRLTIIQGPPGTGKTTTAVEVIKEWLNIDDSPILVCADSNVSVDRVYKELHNNKIPCVRMGSIEKSQYTESNFGRAKQAARQSKVICSTLSTSFIDRTYHTYKRVLIDESTQSTEINALMPLLKSAEQVVLIGDHKQLPPTIISSKAEEKGFGISLFERLINQGVEPFMLDTQYRMHPSISYFPSQAFYDGKLIDGITKSHRKMIKGFNWPVEDKPLAFCNVDGIEDLDGKSRYNLAEIDKVVEILRGFIKADDIPLTSIGVVTAYDSQKKHLAKAIMDLEYSLKIKQIFNKRKYSSFISVDTVDGFQGMEKELIIFSAVRNNNDVITFFII